MGCPEAEEVSGSSQGGRAGGSLVGILGRTEEPPEPARRGLGDGQSAPTLDVALQELLRLDRRGTPSREPDEDAVSGEVSTALERWVGAQAEVGYVESRREVSSKVCGGTVAHDEDL